jgi:ADP-heptose:LPS heptosyltransferase
VKILVVRLSSIGDVVHTTPMVAALIDAGHEVAWAVEPPAAPLVATIPGLSQTFVLPKASAYDWNDRFRLARYCATSIPTWPSTPRARGSRLRDLAQAPPAASAG